MSKPETDWYKALVGSIEGPVFWRKDELPKFPPDDLQMLINCRCGEPLIKEAFIFYENCKRKFHEYSAPLLLDKTLSDLGVGLNKTLLDFGVGWGRIARCFIEHLFKDNIYGVDVDEEFVSMTKSLFGNNNFVSCKPFPPTAFQDSFFDYIVAYSVFSHLSEQATLQWFKEFERILKPGGILAVTTRGRWFLNYCKNLADVENPQPHQKALSIMFDDFDEALRRYDNGEFLHVAAKGISGGGGARNESFYGETFIPPQYAKNSMTDFLDFLEFLHSDHAKGRSHPIMFFRKRIA